ncbi:hypothetical protein BC629DRAFT_1481941 [Irpex lacteus]|nr:hypothetical protein BC629DRAFT_1481941 [Irpex lacteus]
METAMVHLVNYVSEAYVRIYKGGGSESLYPHPFSIPLAFEPAYQYIPRIQYYSKMPSSSRRTKRHTPSTSQRNSSPGASSGSSNSGSSTSDLPNTFTSHGYPENNLEVAVDDLDESLSYFFADGQSVWVRIDEEWIPGVISGKRTQSIHARGSEGLSFPVMYGQHKRKYFAPLNGDIKPDTPDVRVLLQEGGWL